jgi:hypothetical protein
MNDEQEEALVAFLIVIVTGALIHFKSMVLDILNAVATLVYFCFLTLLAPILNAVCALPSFFLAILKQKYHEWRKKTKERRRKAKLDELMKEEENGKRDAPDMPTECPCCLETLFDSNGVAVDDMDIATGLPCEVHLIHSECLLRVGQSLNADGRRYGHIPGYGIPRSGCPVCGREVSFWFTTKKATDFGVFWWHKIQKCIEQVGCENGPVSVYVVMDMLRNDPSLTLEQKSLIIRAPPPPPSSSEEEKEKFRYDEKKYVFEHALERGALEFIPSESPMTVGNTWWAWPHGHRFGILIASKGHCGWKSGPDI